MSDTPSHGFGTSDQAPGKEVASGAEIGSDADPDQAWKSLGLVNDWIKHADAKVGATLAASGVTAVMLYNLVKGEHHPGFWLSLFAIFCGVSVVLAGASAALALIPRLKIETRLARRQALREANTSGAAPVAIPKDDPVNLLFFTNIAKQYDGDGPSYVEVLSALTADRQRLTRQIAHQVHANATVAHRKFTWADRAIKFLIAAVAALGIVATIIGAKG